MQFYSKFLFDSLRTDINCEIYFIADSVLLRFNVVEKNPVPKNLTKPFYIVTKEAPSECILTIKVFVLSSFHP